MNILFAVTHVGFLRNFESTLALLAERGHRIHIATDRRQVADVINGQPIIDRLTRRFPDAFTTETVDFSKRNPWFPYAIAVRAALDYWRYLSPRFDGAPALRARGRENAPAPVRWLTDTPGLSSKKGLAFLQRLFSILERVIPERPEVAALLDRCRPDVLFVTPLLYFGSQQVDYVRGARRRGIPSVLGVGSWDHLTTKGLIHEMPNRMIAWNEQQKGEAVDLHRAGPESVIITGAQAYDHWFATQPSISREEFCARVGLNPARPYLLYLCSSPFIAPHEVPFVKQWIAALRRSDSPTLRTAGILVRPHPQNAAQWASVDLAEFADAVIWPRGGANPIGLDARREYYDSMFHSHAVVGVNTSALIESGIVGRLVYSVRAADFSGTQEGTLHFQHLKNGGLLRLSETLDEHIVQLERSFSSAERDREEIRAFIESFVRPHGLEKPATPLVADAVEATGALRVQPEPLDARLRACQRVLHVGLKVLALPIYFAAGVTRLDRERARARWWLGKQSFFFRKRVSSTWRHAMRPVRLVGRHLRAIAIRTLRLAMPLGLIAGRRVKRLARECASARAQAARRVRRTALRARVRAGEWRRRMMSTDSTT
jgi:hypothetical protein